MAETFIQEETFRWSDVDAMGVVNNAVYLTLFEQARFGYFGSLAVMSGESFPFVLGSTAARFEAPGRSGMRVRIAARVVRLGNKSLDMDYVVRCDDVTLATGTATLVCATLAHRSAGGRVHCEWLFGAAIKQVNCFATNVLDQLGVGIGSKIGVVNRDDVAPAIILVANKHRCRWHRKF